MKPFIFSAFSVLLATGAIAPAAQAFPKTDPTFNLQTQRLSEFDARNKAEDAQQPYDYSQPSSYSAPQTVWTEQESAEPTDATAWEKPEGWQEEQLETASPALSLIQRRHESLDLS